MKWQGILAVGVLASCAITTGAAAQEYEVGHNALQIWNDEAQANVPPAVRYWLFAMLGTFALGLFFVWHRPIARFAVLGFIASLFLSDPIAQALELTVADGQVLSGYVSLMHVIFWSPALYLLLTRRPFFSEFSLFGAWSVAITAVILISFYFDVPGAAIYIDHVVGTGVF